MIIDVTDPRNPVEKALIPSPPGGQSQMARMCLGKDLPGGDPSKVYLMRNVQGGAAAGYQVYDVTDVQNPVLKSSLSGIRSTHKQWWECSTGIAYMPGSKNTGPVWRQAQSMVIYDWHDVNSPPVFIRAFGLPGAQPTGTGVVPPRCTAPSPPTIIRRPRKSWLAGPVRMTSSATASMRRGASATTA